jgi:hypothetical protein
MDNRAVSEGIPSRDGTFRISRRTTLAWLGSAVAAVNITLPSMASAAVAGAEPPGDAKPKGYGNDPDLMHPTVPWPKTMSTRQLELSGVLADMILPPTATAPAPSAVGIPDFVDEWISAPYPDHQRDRGLVLSGLMWLDSEAGKRWGKSFTDVSGEQRLQLLTEVSTPPAQGEGAAAIRYGFFRRFRTISVGAYYSLERNFEEIGYVGNKALKAFPPPTETEIHLINEAIAKLGL